MVGMDQEGMEDRVYRLHYNESQIRMDRMNTVFGIFGAGKNWLESTNNGWFRVDGIDDWN